MNSIDQLRSRRRLYFSLALMAAFALLFFVLQNRGLLVGGDIAGAKLLWLFYALFFWFVLPLLIVMDGRCSAGLRRVYALFLANMSARALIELAMMYVSLTWHPYYGIGHDVFSLFLILILAARLKPQHAVESVLIWNLRVMAAMFVLELGFAWYLLQQLGGGPDPVYFVPNDARHAGVLAVTWAAVAALSIYLCVLARRWLYATAES